MRVNILSLDLSKLYRGKKDAKGIVCFCVFFLTGCSLNNDKAIIGFFLYFFIRKLSKCRSPPFYQFVLKKFKLIGGKKDGRTPKKKKI